MSSSALEGCIDLHSHQQSSHTPHPIAQFVKNLPAMQETQVGFLGWEAPLDQGNGTHLVILPGESHGQTAWWATVHGIKEWATTERLTLSL